MKKESKSEKTVSNNSVSERIMQYLVMGGLWNPESVDPVLLNKLLIDARDEIDKLQDSLDNSQKLNGCLYQAIHAYNEILAKYKPIEVWKGDRKVSIYPDVVIRIWGSHIDNEMSEQPTTHDSVAAALDWLYERTPAMESNLSSNPATNPLLERYETLRRQLARLGDFAPDDAIRCNQSLNYTFKNLGALQASSVIRDAALAMAMLLDDMASAINKLPDEPPAVPLEAFNFLLRTAVRMNSKLKELTGNGYSHDIDIAHARGKAGLLSVASPETTGDVLSGLMERAADALAQDRGTSQAGPLELGLRRCVAMLRDNWHAADVITHCICMDDSRHGHGSDCPRATTNATLRGNEI